MSIREPCDNGYKVAAVGVQVAIEVRYRNNFQGV